MKSALPVLAAGGSFAGAVLAGLGAGVWIGDRTAQPLCVPFGLAAGVAIGVYAALRLLFRSV